MKELTRETGAALILITHDLGVVARYADRVAVMYAGRIMESAPATDIYDSPAHPYTQGLMASIPDLAGDVTQALPTIEGQPPDLAAPPPGCAFEPRCPFSSDMCATAIPDLVCSERRAHSRLYKLWLETAGWAGTTNRHHAVTAANGSTPVSTRF